MSKFNTQWAGADDEYDAYVQIACGIGVRKMCIWYEIYWNWDYHFEQNRYFVLRDLWSILWPHYEWRMHKHCNFVPNDRHRKCWSRVFFFFLLISNVSIPHPSRLAEMRNIFICVNNLQNYRLNQQPAIQHHVNYIWINRKCQYQILHRMFASTGHTPPAT